MIKTIFAHKGTRYDLSAKRTKAEIEKLPEAVKKAIQGDKYKEPIIEE